ncbi:MAG TPA: flagellar export protein FliJ [Nitrospiraceae bacterium]|jgi:flagellar export protein FliJ|nr:flagellar export protein FliJ [Nitrospiraceae bacterium]
MSLERVSKILELKGFTKEQLEIEVEKSVDELNAEKEKLDSIISTFEGAIDEFNDKQKRGPVRSGDLEVFYRYFQHLKKQIEQQKLAVVKKRLDVDIKRNAMIEAYKEKRVFEILHNKMLQEEMRETSLNEQKDADFDFVARKIRK